MLRIHRPPRETQREPTALAAAGRIVLLNIYLDQADLLGCQVAEQEGGLTYLASRCALNPTLAESAWISVTAINGDCYEAGPCRPSEMRAPSQRPGLPGLFFKMIDVGEFKGSLFLNVDGGDFVLDIVLCCGRAPRFASDADIRIVEGFRSGQGGNRQALVVATNPLLEFEGSSAPDPSPNYEVLRALSVHHDLVVMRRLDWATVFEEVARILDVAVDDPRRVATPPDRPHLTDLRASLSTFIQWLLAPFWGLSSQNPG